MQSDGKSAGCQHGRSRRGRPTDRSLAALRAALLALLDRRPFEEITTRDIVAEAGTSSATFYRHYRTKADLLRAIASEEIDLLVKMSSTLLVSSGSRGVAIAQVRHLHQRRHLWNLLLNGGAAGFVRESFVARLSEEYAQNHPDLKTWLPNDLGILFSVTVVIEIVAWWLRQDEMPSVETVAEMLDRLAIRPPLAL